ncbi:MAG: hypothetical protein OER21_13580 [Gemmatimonadota bacterium]|nr:hypothetical protein [Gemmatimonadota bacterium]
MPHGSTRIAVTRALLCGLLWLVSPSVVSAQLLTIGGGALVTTRSTEPVGELHGETPPLARARGYVTLSWTDESTKPTVISAAERPVIHVGRAFAGLGAGLLWLEGNGYRPYPMLVSSTVVPLPVPRTSFVLIASTLPFQDFDWSLVFKVGVTLVFVR